MARAFLFVLVLLPALVHSAPALKDRPTAPSVVGEWKRTGHTQAGTPVGPDQSGHWQTFKANGEWSYSYGGMNSGSLGMSFTTDPKQNPPTIDICLKKNAPSAYRGIYKIEGDTLTLCLVMGNDRDRPKTFESSPDQPTTIWIFTRVKAKD